MNLITPFEFVRRFPEGQRVAVVGNAPSVLERRLGEYIDAHDVVVRFNECALESYAEFVGERTDILVSNPYPEGRKRSLLDGNRAKVVLIITPQTRRGDQSVFEQWVGDHDVLFTYTPDLVRVEDSSHMAGLTTGTYALQLLWRLLRPRRLTCTGFTMFDRAQSTPQHYWAVQAPAGMAAHDLATEARIFVSVLNSMKQPVDVTPEVLSIARRHRVQFAPHVRLLDVGGPS